MEGCLRVTSLIVGEVRTAAHDADILLLVIDESAQQQGIVNLQGDAEQQLEPVGSFQLQLEGEIVVGSAYRRHAGQGGQVARHHIGDALG